MNEYLHILKLNSCLVDVKSLTGCVMIEPRNVLNFGVSQN